MDAVKAPFTPEQVESLNGFQHWGYWHPFTCGGQITDEKGEKRDCRCILRATENGWVCDQCDYTQDWAHDFMANGAWRKAADMYKGITDGNDATK